MTPDTPLWPARWHRRTYPCHEDDVQLPNDLVRCPDCRQRFLRMVWTSEVCCEGCSSAYPLCDGVVDLLPGAPTKRSLAQATMEFEPIVCIYESWLWRRSAWMALAFGLSFEQELDLIIRALDVSGVATVLDLACGPGIYSRPLARRVPAGTVVGLDLSLPMLRTAVRLASREHVANLIFLHGSALDLPFAADRFDAVNCCGALHLFPDVPQALSEIQRVLVPGGRFTVAALRRGEGTVSDLANVLCRRVAGVGAFTSHELEARLRGAGFEDVGRHHTGCVWQIVCGVKPGRSE
jgi:SAM-dependent methyltransferase